MEFAMKDVWGMVQVIGIPLFLWMERRTTRAQADAQWARSTAEQASEAAKQALSGLEKLRGEHAMLTSEVLSKVEAVAVAVARIEGSLQYLRDGRV